MAKPIDGAAAASMIAGLIRRAISDRSRTRADGKPVESRSGGSGGTQASPGLSEIISSRALELNPDAPDFRSKMLRLTVEASLVQEFGSSLLTAPKFQELVDQVHSQLESSAQLRDDIDAALAALGAHPKN